MSVIKFNRDFENLFNWDTDLNPTTEQNYQAAVQNWTETEMNLVDTLLWQPQTEYEVGNIVKTPSLPSQYVLLCTTSGESGAEEPSYSGTQLNDSVEDGTVVWRISQIAVGALPLIETLANFDASNIGINAETDNSEMWGEAIGGGAITEDENRLVTGKTVYAVINPVRNAIAANTEDIATNANNIESFEQENASLFNAIIELAELVPDTETFIVTLYVNRILAERMTIDDVPAQWQESVREALEDV